MFLYLIPICVTLYSYACKKDISFKYFISKIGYNIIYYVSYIQIYLQKMSCNPMITDSNNDIQLLVLMVENNTFLKMLTYKNNPFDKTKTTNIFLSQNEKYDMSDIQFIDVSLVYNNETYPISLKTDTYNLYIVGNKLDKYFVEYYMKHFSNIDINLLDVDYNLNIIDQNADMVTLTNVNVLTLNKIDYKIV